jgi:AraC-like DNA-binding protein
MSRFSRRLIARPERACTYSDFDEGWLMLGTYREWAPQAALREQAACVWIRRVGRDVARPVRVVPDGCIDLIWMNGDLHIAGPDTKAWLSHISPGTDIVGLRFRPGAAPPILGIPATELVNQRVPTSALWGRAGAALTSRLQGAATPARALEVLQDGVRARASNAPAIDPVVRHFVAMVSGADRRYETRLPAFEEMFGLSERQLRRRCLAALGYGPKMLTRILRFQHFLELARPAPAGTLAQVAAQAGYADQPHLNRDVVGLSGLSPAALVASLTRS